MTDIFSKSKRSEVMSKIRSKNTSLEKRTKTLLRRSKIKYKSQPKIFGHPDFLIKKKIVLFCDSSFWHGRNWKNLKSRLENGNNATYWTSHIAGNRKRDRIVNRKLRKDGYLVIRLWDEDIYKRSEWCGEKIKKSI